jgi:hypothetical protein
LECTHMKIQESNVLLPQCTSKKHYTTTYHENRTPALDTFKQLQHDAHDSSALRVRGLEGSVLGASVIPVMNESSRNHLPRHAAHATRCVRTNGTGGKQRQQCRCTAEEAPWCAERTPFGDPAPYMRIWYLMGFLGLYFFVTVRPAVCIHSTKQEAEC